MSREGCFVSDRVSTGGALNSGAVFVFRRSGGQFAQEVRGVACCGGRLSLPLTAGRTLAEWNAIERRKLQPSDVVEVISQVAKGVAALHEAGVAHVDLKPDNILLWNDPFG